MQPSFADDTPGFWAGFWDRNSGYGAGALDPDVHSPGLKRMHQVLWSRELPCGSTMELRDDGTYLSWNGFRFSSDSLTTFFRGPSMSGVLDPLMSSEGYRSRVEDMVRRTYTPGGAIILPRHRNSFNQRRGLHPMIRDRWDRSLECIRRFYADDESPLSDVLEQDRGFFELFVDFRGYVDFFLLNDWVDSGYRVRSCLGPLVFDLSPLPRDAGEYREWSDSQLRLTELRNRRISSLTDAFHDVF